MVSCKDCVWGKFIDDEVRFNLGQENKEILNVLLDRRFRLGEFCYCEKLGFIESVILKRDCEHWSFVSDLEGI